MERGRIGRWVGLWAVLSLVVAMAPPLLADEEWPGYLNGATQKLGRGLSNVGTAPMELLREPTLVGERDGGLASATVGVIRGITSAVFRAAAGVVEVVTFLIPLPRNFAPLYRPEYVWIHGQWAP